MASFFTRDKWDLVSASVSWQFSDRLIASVLIVRNLLLLYYVAYISCMFYGYYATFVEDVVTLFLRMINGFLVSASVS